MESLAAKQGATEGLLTTPEERLEEEPEWVRQAKSVGAQTQEVPATPVPQEAAEEIPAAEPEPSASLEELGKSETERDDAFAWLESLAAKQGATEGLLTKPEERLEEEPEWVKQAKDISAEQIAAPEQPSSVEDTAAWLRSLDEEEAITSPEPASSKDDTSIWFKNLEEPQKEAPPEPVQETQPEELPSWMQNLEEDRASETVFNVPVSDAVASAQEPKDEATQPSQAEELPEWMQGIEEDKASETVHNIPISDIAARAAEEESAQVQQPEALPEWMQGIEEDRASETDLNLPAIEPTAETREQEPAVDTEWMSAIEQESVMESAATDEESAQAPAEELPGWLSELDQEKQQAVTPTALDADLPAWLRDETGEVVAEPTKIEPTRTTDWQPVETKQPEPEPEPVASQPETQAPANRNLS